jgi:hypothetical protein
VRVKRSRFGFLGPTLYDEKNVYLAAKAAIALDALFPEWKLPVRISNPILSAFANALWQCPTAAAVAVMLNTAMQEGGANS